MLRDLGLYGVLLFLLAIAAFGWRSDEAALPQQSSFPWPEVAIRGLSVPASAAVPAFTAEHARPEAGGAVKLGGWHDRLQLTGITVALDSNRSLTAESGEYTAGSLTVIGKVTVEADGKRRLQAARVVFRAGQVQLPGVSVFHTAAGPETAVELTLSAAEFAEKFR